MNLTLEQLPSLAQELADAIGLPATLRLVDALGGTRIYVPEHAGPDHLLTRAIGQADADRLCDVFAHDTLELPKCLDGIRAVRNGEIRDQRADGWDVNRIALYHGLTVRQVYSILADASVDDSQQDLFG